MCLHLMPEMPELLALPAVGDRGSVIPGISTACIAASGLVSNVFLGVSEQRINVPKIDTQEINT